ncbi:GNAT family N-acetyltransferase [Halomarina ordinaria]|uniref:GNAT family N-acetyltransferase n=1 Tax=Halomarina ordinaria TaxID=3033939 RepID=A0ABD5UAR3_9EURY|nr:GNAT family N-acetyltransferase [Halomarina sp. PSRA2]
MVNFIPLVPESPAFERVIDCYRDVWASAGEGEARTSVAERFSAHATYPGYRGVVALATDPDELAAAGVEGEDEAVLGYCYGYASRPDQYYHGLLRESLPVEEGDRWLADCFEFVELGVHVGARERGLGSTLHDALLDGVENATSLLTTGVENDPARRFYERRGWDVVHEPFESDDGRPYVVMGRSLGQDAGAAGSDRGRV